MATPDSCVGGAAARNLLEASTPDDVYCSVLEAIHSRLDADASAVAIRGSDARATAMKGSDAAAADESTLTVVAESGDERVGADFARSSRTADLLHRSVRNGQSCLIGDGASTRSVAANDDTRESSGDSADEAPVDESADEAIGSILCTPIGSVGVVFAIDRNTDAFSEADREWIEELSGLVESSLERFPPSEIQVPASESAERTRRNRELRDHATDLKQLYRSANRLYAAETVDECYEITIAAALDILGFDWCTIVAPTEDGCAFEVKAISEAGDLEIGDRPFGVNDGIAGEVYRTKEPRLVTDVPRTPKAQPTNDAIRSGIAVPVGEWGVLQVISTDRIDLDERDHNKVELLATSTATAIERIERRETLEARTAELERQNERLDRFVSIVSHDLRNPLAVCRGRLELAAEECDNAHLESVRQAIDRMDDLVENLLALAREGEEVGEFVSVDIGALAEECWSIVDTDGDTLAVETDRVISADKDRLQQLLENLLGNAVRHGGDDVTVTIGELEEGFYVADDGPGIPADEREAVLEWGRSGDGTGTGYGLAIVEQIVQAHGWEIDIVESATGGARFEITGVKSASGIESVGSTRLPE